LFANNWGAREMRFKISMILELIIPFSLALFLAGCFGGGGGSTYDGTWTVGYVTSAPILNTGTASITGVCSVQNPLPTITLVNGTGSTSQTNSCTFTPASGVAITQPYIYLISVAINSSTNVVNAIVNGVPLTGQCISAYGCAAQAGTSTLSLTR
jgi:hypothetical protein